jgi:hypothetical protein
MCRDLLASIEKDFERPNQVEQSKEEEAEEPPKPATTSLWTLPTGQVSFVSTQNTLFSAQLYYCVA